MSHPNGQDIKRVAVVGAGTMGGGIAQVLIKSGYSVTLNDVAEKFLAKATDRIAKGLAREVEKGRMTTEERDAALARLTTTTDLSALAAADFVIEAVIETFEAKASVFKTLDPLARPEVIFASNTSSISITKLAAATNRPAQFIGLHFWKSVV